MRGFGVVTVTLFTCKPVLFSLVDTAPNRRSVCANSGQWWAPKIWPSVAWDDCYRGAEVERVAGVGVPQRVCRSGARDQLRNWLSLRTNRPPVFPGLNSPLTPTGP